MREIPVPLGESSHPDALGKLGDYDVLAVLGGGGMGDVLKAFDPNLHRNVAIKVMTEKLLQSDNARERFFREARSAAAINHPNVTTVFAAGEQGGFPYLVMELVEGQTLDEKIKESPRLSVVDGLRISAQIASGLAAAHEQGIIHRDIKPGNILLENGIHRAKVSDFGLALLYTEKSDLTSDDHVVGTPSYMSPEQVEGDRLTVTSDLFSLGVIIYTMFSGKPPFQADSLLATAHRIVDHNPPRLDQVEPEVPSELADIVENLMHKNPQRRPQSAADLATDLQKLAARQTALSLQKTTVLARQLHSPSRKKWPVIVLGVMLCGLLVAGWLQGFAFNNAGQDRSPTVTTTQINEIRSDGVITVGRQGEVSTIMQAVGIATPGIELRLAAEEFFETIALTSREQLRDVRLNGAGAMLKAPPGSPIITIDGIPGLTITGLNCRALPNQSALVISGQSPGLRVSDSHLESLDRTIASRPLILMTEASGEGDEDRIVLERLTLAAGGAAIVVGDEIKDKAFPRNIEITNCDISAKGRESGIPIVLYGPIENLSISECTFADGESAVSIVLPESGQANNIRFERCTFHNFNALMYVNNSVPEQDFAFHDCLLVDVVLFNEPQAGQYSFDTWMDNNGFVEITPMDPALKDILPIEVRLQELSSIDPAEETYLRPAGESREIWPGRFQNVLQLP